MNTYQITAFRTRELGEKPEDATERIDAESLKEARAVFRKTHSRSEWLITQEELLYIGSPTGRDAEQEKPGVARADAPEELEAANPEEEKGQAAQQEAERAMQKEALRRVCRELAEAREQAEAQAIRAERAEEEIIRLKAKLYDCMAAGA